MSAQPPDAGSDAPAPTGPATGPAPAGPACTSAQTSRTAPPAHEGDHLDGSGAHSESERELVETVRSISRLEESN